MTTREDKLGIRICYDIDEILEEHEDALEDLTNDTELLRNLLNVYHRGVERWLLSKIKNNIPVNLKKLKKIIRYSGENPDKVKKKIEKKIKNIKEIQKALRRDTAEIIIGNYDIVYGYFKYLEDYYKDLKVGLEYLTDTEKKAKELVELLDDTEDAADLYELIVDAFVLEALKNIIKKYKEIIDKFPSLKEKIKEKVRELRIEEKINKIEKRRAISQEEGKEKKEEILMFKISQKLKKLADDLLELL